MVTIHAMNSCNVFFSYNYSQINPSNIYSNVISIIYEKSSKDMSRVLRIVNKRSIKT